MMTPSFHFSTTRPTLPKIVQRPLRVSLCVQSKTANPCVGSPFRNLNGFLGNWNLNVQWTVHSGFPFAFPNAAPLVAQSAKLSDDQRDAAARKAGRSQFDPSYDVWFNTSIFPTDAQAPFTLQNFPTIFPDVRSKAMDVWEMSIYKEIPIKERLRWQIRGDFHNAFNHPWFGNLGSNDVTDPKFGQLGVSSIDDTSEPRLIVLVMKIVF